MKMVEATIDRNTHFPVEGGRYVNIGTFKDSCEEPCLNEFGLYW